MDRAADGYPEAACNECPVCITSSAVDVFTAYPTTNCPLMDDPDVNVNRKVVDFTRLYFIGTSAKLPLSYSPAFLAYKASRCAAAETQSSTGQTGTESCTFTAMSDAITSSTGIVAGQSRFFAADLCVLADVETTCTAAYLVDFQDPAKSVSFSNVLVKQISGTNSKCGRLLVSSCHEFRGNSIELHADGSLVVPSGVANALQSAQIIDTKQCTASQNYAKDLYIGAKEVRLVLDCQKSPSDISTFQTTTVDQVAGKATLKTPMDMPSFPKQDDAYIMVMESFHPCGHECTDQDVAFGRAVERHGKLYKSRNTFLMHGQSNSFLEEEL